MGFLTLLNLAAAYFVLEETKGRVEEDEVSLVAAAAAVDEALKEEAPADSDADDVEAENVGLIVQPPDRVVVSTGFACPARSAGFAPTNPVPASLTRNSWSSLWSDNLLRTALSIYASLGLLVLISQEVLSLLLVLPVSEGGYALTSRDLGFLALSTGVPLLLTQAFLFAPLVERYGVLRILFGSLLGFGVLVMCHPALTLLATITTSEQQWIALLTLSWATCIVRVSAFTAVFIVVANSALPVDRARANGLGQALVSLVRAIGPPIFTPLFAMTIAQGAYTLQAVFVWFILAAAAVYTAWIAHNLPPSASLKRTA